MKNIKLVTFLLVSALGTTAAMASPVGTFGNPDSVGQAAASAYRLGQMIDPSMSLNHNNRWSTDNAVNGINTLKYLSKQTAKNVNNKYEKEGVSTRVDAQGIYNDLWTAFQYGTLNSGTPKYND